MKASEIQSDRTYCGRRGNLRRVVAVLKPTGPFGCEVHWLPAPPPGPNRTAANVMLLQSFARWAVKAVEEVWE